MRGFIYREKKTIRRKSRSDIRLFYFKFDLSAESELTLLGDDKRIGICERKLAAQRLKKLFLSHYKFNLGRRFRRICTDLTLNAIARWMKKEEGYKEQ